MLLVSSDFYPFFLKGTFLNTPLFSGDHFPFCAAAESPPGLASVVCHCVKSLLPGAVLSGSPVGLTCEPTKRVRGRL